MNLYTSDETMKIDANRHPRTAAVLCWKNEQMVVIEDIPSEVERDPNTVRWEDLRPNQHRDYKSMVCTPMTKGVPQTPSREVIGVLVIDTNRERYFKEERDYEAFLSTVLAPYRNLIVLFYEIERQQKLFVEALKKLS